MMLGGYQIGARLIAMVVGALLLIVAAGLFLRSCQSAKTANKQAEVSEGQAGASIAAGAEAVNTAAKIIASDNATDAQVAAAQAEIAAAAAGQKGAAAKREACRFRAYKKFRRMLGFAPMMCYENRAGAARQTPPGPDHHARISSMTAPIDITGQRFGRLVALKMETAENRNGRWHSRWRCRCDCGRETTRTADSLKKGHTTSCSYCKAPLINITGQRFGKLVALRLDGRYANKCPRCKEPVEP